MSRAASPTHARPHLPHTPTHTSQSFRINHAAHTLCPPKMALSTLPPRHPFLPSPPRRPPPPPPITRHPSPQPSLPSLPPELVPTAETAKCSYKKTGARRGTLRPAVAAPTEQPEAKPPPACACPTIMELHLELGTLKESVAAPAALRQGNRSAAPIQH